MLGWSRVVGVALLAGALAVAGCSASGGGGPSRGGGDGGGGMDASAGDDGGGGADSGGGRDSGGGGWRDGGIDECDSIAMEAESEVAPVDVIFVVDSSGSMSEEAGFVQSEMDDFAAEFRASDIDFHIVGISDPGYLTLPGDPEFLFVDQAVGSNAPLQVLLDTFDRYSDFLREDAVTHFVAVTDDNSGLPAADFKSMMETKLGHEFTFHAIASPPGETHEECVPILGVCMTEDGCESSHGNAAENGEVYWPLADMTGGEKFSICAEDWTPLFMTLAEEVVVGTLLPCTFELPEPPEGMEFNKDEVNVVFTRSDGTTETFGRVDGPSECADGAWYYDDPDMPTQIEMCPGTCDRIEADDGGSIDIALGCDTIPY